MTDSQTHILLIDPFLDEREMYAHFLQERGFQVTISDDPLQALELAADGQVSAVIARIRQYGSIDGVELTQRVKSDARTRHIPVLIISTLVQPEFRAAAEAAGCDRFLLLPCLPDTLASELLQLTRGRTPGPPSD